MKKRYVIADKLEKSLMLERLVSKLPTDSPNTMLLCSSGLDHSYFTEGIEAMGRAKVITGLTEGLGDYDDAFNPNRVLATSLGNVDVEVVNFSQLTDATEGIFFCATTLIDKLEEKLKFCKNIVGVNLHELHYGGNKLKETEIIIIKGLHTGFHVVEKCSDDPVQTKDEFLALQEIAFKDSPIQLIWTGQLRILTMGPEVLDELEEEKTERYIDEDIQGFGGACNGLFIPTEEGVVYSEGALVFISLK